MPARRGAGPSEATVLLEPRAFRKESEGCS